MHWPNAKLCPDIGRVSQPLSLFTRPILEANSALGYSHVSIYKKALTNAKLESRVN
jgi:hypothetical protein